MKKNKKSIITFGEKILYTSALFCFGFLLVMQIFFGAKINNLKMNIEYTNLEIEKENKKMESLTMKFNELTSYENVKGTIKDMGLAYNNENIIVISSEN
jgi:cell division protein FtsL